MKTRKVLIVGTLPPPIGGVSIHLERFMGLLAKDEFDAGLLNLKKRELSRAANKTRSFFSIVSFFMMSDLVHIHVSNNVKLILVLVSRLFGKRVIYTHHNNIIKNKVVFYLVYFFSSAVVFVSDKCIPEALLAKKRRKWTVIPAFIPPLDELALPNELSEKIKHYDVVVGFNAYRKAFIFGEEVYGVDLVLAVYKELVSKNAVKNLGFVFFDPSGTHCTQVQKELSDMSEDRRSGFIYESREGLSFYELLKLCTVSLRPTRTDGDSLSVRESLNLGVPVIASDIVERPEGTIVFESGSQEDLYRKLVEVLRNPPKIVKGGECFYSEVICLYHELLCGKWAS